MYILNIEEKTLVFWETYRGVECNLLSVFSRLIYLKNPLNFEGKIDSESETNAVATDPNEREL